MVLNIGPLALDLKDPLCYKTLCRFNCILYTGPTLTRTDN